MRLPPVFSLAAAVLATGVFWLGTPYCPPLVAAEAAKPAQAEAAAAPEAPSMPELVHQYVADMQSARGALVLPSSQESLDRLVGVVRQWKRRLDSIALKRLDRDGQLDYVLLENHLGQSLCELKRRRERLAEIEPFIGFRKVILELELARRRAEPIDLAETAEKLAALADEVEKLRKRVKKADSGEEEPDAADGKAGPDEEQQDQKVPAGKQDEGAEAAANDDSAKDKSAEKDSTEGDSSSNGAEVDDDPAPLPVAPATALRAARAAEALRGQLSSWHKHYSGYKPKFNWWIEQPYKQADKQLKEYVKKLKEEIAGQKGEPEDPIVGQPIGAEAIAADLGFEMISYDADALIAIGRRQLAWGEAEMKKAAKEMGHGDDWKAAMDEVKAQHMPPGEQAELIAEIGREATRFVTERELLTVPPLSQATWRLTIMSPEQLKTIPYAAYSSQRMLVAYAQQSMSQADKLMVMRGNNRHFTRLVTPHELIPGHHLQRFYLARYNSHRQVFGTPFYTEGWALYWERRLYELGWPKSPEDRIGMLFWWMTRAARIIVSLEYHLGRMEPDEMVDFLIDRVGHERFGARSEVRRFVQAPPLYQVGYMIGGLQLDALHHAQVEQGPMTEREFHDTVLKAGPMPIALMRAWMQDKPLKPGMRPKWPFAPEPNGS